jgi:hypothetical protein
MIFNRNYISLSVNSLIVVAFLLKIKRKLTTSNRKPFEWPPYIVVIPFSSTAVVVGYTKSYEIGKMLARKFSWKCDILDRDGIARLKHSIERNYTFHTVDVLESDDYARTFSKSNMDQLKIMQIVEACNVL